ncbi:MAG: COQ9 family protein [Parvularculaceae bacterium]|nr:COQ9 family protein [Parvularculaceae bacterium]
MTETESAFARERAALLDAAVKRAPFEGWTRVMMSRAAAGAGVPRAVLAAAFPNGVADLLECWSAQLDRAAVVALGGPAAQGLKIREKVALGVRARLAAMRPDKEAARRAAATLALPLYATLAPKLVWRTADAIWRGLGDASTDFNYYTKRAILSGVWVSTFARWLSDDGEGETATNAFLDRRIDNVMQFEKAKARLRDRGFDPAAFFGALARVRYPER